MISYILRDGYLCFAAVLDAPVLIQQLCLSSFDHRFDFRSTSKLVSCIGSVQFVSWTFTYRAVIGRAHGRVRNLKPIHTQQVPETQPLPHLSVCKSKMPVHRTQLIDLCNDRVHAAVYHTTLYIYHMLYHILTYSILVVLGSCAWGMWRWYTGQSRLELCLDQLSPGQLEKRQNH